jgi:hypothetical protein
LVTYLSAIEVCDFDEWLLPVRAVALKESVVYGITGSDLSVIVPFPLVEIIGSKGI